MSASTFYVDISPQETLQLLDRGIIDGSITGERIDCHTVRGGNGCSFIVAVYEKHYYRAGNRLTLTVSIDDMDGITRVHAVGGGGGEGLFRFDWGAGDDFSNAPVHILRDHVARR